MSEPKIGTVADVQNYARDHSWGEPRPVVLPKSGITVAIRQPTELYHALAQAQWPDELRGKVDGAQSQQQLAGLLTPEEVRIIDADRRRMMQESFVEPKASFVTCEDAFHPNLLPREDRDFIYSYLRGETVANGASLENFCPSEQKTVGDGGDSGK